MNFWLVVIVSEVLVGIGAGRMAARWLSGMGRRENNCLRQVCGGISSTVVRSAKRPTLRLVTATDSWSADVADRSVLFDRTFSSVRFEACRCCRT
jgi:hypothetical protein